MGNVKLETFFAQHSVFTFEVVSNALSKNQQVNPSKAISPPKDHP